MVDEVSTANDNAEHTEATMSTTSKKKKTRKVKGPKAAKVAKGKATKAVKASKLTDKGLPTRPRYDQQIGIRVSAEERSTLVDKCQKEGHYSLSNAIRGALGFPPLR